MCLRHPVLLFSYTFSTVTIARNSQVEKCQSADKERIHQLTLQNSKSFHTEHSVVYTFSTVTIARNSLDEQMIMGWLCLVEVP